MNGYLDQFVESLKTIEKGLPNYAIAVKISSSSFIFYSTAYQKLMGLPEKINEDHTNSFLPGFNEEAQRRVIDEDELVLKHGKISQSLKIQQLNNITQPLLEIKEPIINPATGTVAGIFCFIKKLHMNNLSQELIKPFGKVITQAEIQSYNLSRREKQIIFLFISHLGSQEIAAVLSQLENKPVSKSTIDNIFVEQIFAKFSVYNRVELRKRLIQLGFAQLIPIDILKSTVIPLNELMVY